MKRYEVDHDWAWGTKRPGDPVTLRGTFTFDDAATAKQAVAAFFADLEEANGFHGSGGWVACEAGNANSGRSRMIDFVAGGEDVADAVGYAADEAYEHFAAYDGATAEWEQRPYEA
ncbi:hypothetical protein CAPI_07635 [Corynebacterium capitovis DSM 44611]|uniref:hypothetical protein n=1 Tax=Corynebacterium capitovis TaxID=131081 RepID=UPI0003767119|nr:hypothetical protein [Corynebacterium capitovis]WKD58063.1 hypothetical protein CAPI_07635 [Corynebacterium capitovis DSM 44611]